MKEVRHRPRIGGDVTFKSVTISILCTPCKKVASHVMQITTAYPKANSGPNLGTQWGKTQAFLAYPAIGVMGKYRPCALGARALGEGEIVWRVFTAIASSGERSRVNALSVFVSSIFL